MLHEEILDVARERLGVKDLAIASLFGNCFQLVEIKPLYKYAPVENNWGVKRMYPTKEVIGYNCLVMIVEGAYEGFLLQIKVLDPVVPELPERTTEQPVYYGLFKNVSCSYVKSENCFPIYLQAEDMTMIPTLSEDRIIPF